MRRRDIGFILLVVGVLCGISFTVLNLCGVINTRLGELMMYGGIITLAAGLILFGTSSSKSQAVRK
jgi:hypothetical protein